MFCAETLKACNLTCGHQDVFRHEHTLGARQHWGRYHGDSSFEAVPMLHTLDKSVLIVTVLREPLAVLRSWRKKGLFVDRLRTWEMWGLFSRVLDKHFPEVLANEDPMAAAATYYVSWLTEALKYSHSVLKIEGLTAAELCRAVDRPDMYVPAGDAIPRDTNTNVGDLPELGPDSYEDIPEGARDGLLEFAQSMGYE